MYVCKPLYYRSALEDNRIWLEEDALGTGRRDAFPGNTGTSEVRATVF